MRHFTSEPGTTVADRLTALRHQRFVGREHEISQFTSLIRQPASPYVAMYVHGPGGTGKSMLLNEFAHAARQAGWRVVQIDARNVQLSRSGLMGEIEAAGLPQPGTDQRLALLIDTCETIAPLDAWIREDLLPQLPGDSLTVLASRTPPDTGWQTRPGWGDLACIIPLRNFHPGESRVYLEQRGIPLSRHEAILTFTHGHPLALSLVADATLANDGFEHLTDDENVVRALMQQFHRSEPSPQHRMALEIAARARVTTESLLADTFGDEQGHHLFSWLERLSFMDHDGEGLFPHDLVRDVVEADLRRRNPTRYEDVHRLVHRHVIQRIRQTQGMEHLRALHSLMFLHRNNPVWQPYIGNDEYGHNYTTPAGPADTSTILEIVRRHEGAESAAIARYWLQRQPGSFHLVRGLQEQVTGIIALILLDEVRPEDAEADPAVRLTMAHLDAHQPLLPGQVVGFIRFAMGNQTYRNPSTPMSISVHGAAAAYGEPRLAVSNMVVSEPGFWRQHFAYVNHTPFAGGEFRLGERTFTIFSHDWRREPLERFDEILTQREISTSMQIEPPPTDGEPVVSLSRTEFDESVRRALRTGLAPARLHGNPLLRSHLVVRGRGSIPAADFLASTIHDAVSTLQDNARTVRNYRAIERTYLDPAPSQERAAEDLDLPFSTYRRHLTTGLDLVAGELWHRELQAASGLSKK